MAPSGHDSDAMVGDDFASMESDRNSAARDLTRANRRICSRDAFESSC